MADFPAVQSVKDDLAAHTTAINAMRQILISMGVSGGDLSSLRDALVGVKDNNPSLLTPADAITTLRTITGTLQGASNVFLLTPVKAPLTLLAGMRAWGVSNYTNTAAATLQIKGVTPVRNIKLPNGSAPIGGEIVANQPADFIFDGTNWLLLNSALANSSLVYRYADATGEGGADATDQIVGTAGHAQGIIPAGTLTAVKQSLYIRVDLIATGAAAITVTLRLGTTGTLAVPDQALITLAGNSLVNRCVIDGIVSYIDATTLHFSGWIAHGAGGGISGSNGNGSTNVAWGSQMFLSIEQGNTALNHLIVNDVHVTKSI